jgi:hypothetical protein
MSQGDSRGPQSGSEGANLEPTLTPALSRQREREIWYVCNVYV